MKKLWFFFAMFVCVLASCSDGGSDDPSNPTPKPDEVKAEITIDSSIVTNGLSFSTSGGEQSVSFSVNANWALSVASTSGGSTWCKPSATSGSKGTANVKFTVTENTDYDDRSVSVTIKAGTASKTFTITQKGMDALLVTTSKYEVAQEGGQIEIEVKANINYQMEISESAKTWITESKSKSRALTTHKHKLDIAMNEEAEKREGEITFKSGDKVETVKVYQAGGAIILLSKNEYTVSNAGETITVDIKSNVEYGVQMPDVDWIEDEASGRGMSSHTLKYVIAANEGYDSRSAEIIFYDKNSDLKDTLKVVQAQKDAIVISEKNISVAKEGGTVEIKVNTNVDFEVQIPAEATWISQTDSRALTKKSIYLKVAENTGDDSRSAEITLISKNNQLSETIVVNQQGNILIIKLEKSGFLETFLENVKGRIKHLKIIGRLNGYDINALKDWRRYDNRLVMLDLSEAIISGGTYKHYRDHGYDYIDVEDNVITRGMFDFSIAKLVLPRNIVTIRNHAIAVAGLEIDLPISLKTIEYYAFDSDQYSGSYEPECINIPDLTMWCNIPLETFILASDGKLTLNGSDITNLIIPKELTKVGNYSFSRCSSLVSVEIHEQIDSIGGYSFASCSGLEKVKMENGLTVIGVGAFMDCSKMVDVELPKSLMTIREYAFRKCGIQSISLPESLNNIESGAFQYCEELKELTIPVGLTKIENATFQGCTSLSVLKIGENVESIGNDNFYKSPLTAVYCASINPPTLGYNNFKKSNTCKLYVPKGCKAKYEASQWNSYFYEIIEMD